MAVDDLRADIEYIKSLIDDDGSGKRCGAIWMITSGVVFSLAALVEEGAVERAGHFASPWWVTLLWLSAAIVDYAIASALTVGLSRFQTVPGRARRAVGRATGLTIAVLVVAGLVSTYIGHNWRVWAFFPSIALAIFASYLVGDRRRRASELAQLGSRRSATSRPRCSRPSPCGPKALCLWRCA